MKKVLKVIGILFLFLAGLIVLFFVKAASTPAAPKNYTETVETGGAIESTYLKNGSCKVAYYEQKTDEDYKKFEVWYPEELKTENRAYPLIVVLNGTGVKASKYKAQFEHFASWGFIVIGTEEEEAWDGVAAEDSLMFMLTENENESSVFYHKVDTEKIGALGHSQGGAGVFNAVTARDHSAIYKTAVSLSPANEELAEALGWHYDVTGIQIPILLFAGTEGDFEMETVIPAEKLPEIYDKLDAPKVMARKKGCEHGDMLYSADGYVTAWFLWRLQGNEDAAGAFIGASPELLSNELYQEQQIDLP